MAKIANTGTGTPTRGEYACRFEARDGRPWRLSNVYDFPRKRLTAWDLLYRALKAAGLDERNP